MTNAEHEFAPTFERLTAVEKDYSRLDETGGGASR